MNSRTVRKKVTIYLLIVLGISIIPYSMASKQTCMDYTSLIMMFTGSSIHRNVKFSYKHSENQLHPIEMTVITTGRTGNAMLISLVGMDPALRGAAARSLR